jgi:hypothetical protein
VRRSAAARARHAIDATAFGPLSVELLRVPRSECEDQEHDPAVWDVRSSLLAAQHVLAQLQPGPRDGPLAMLAERGTVQGDVVAALGVIEEAMATLEQVASSALAVTAADEARAAMTGRSVGAAVPLADLFTELKDKPEERTGAPLPLGSPLDYLHARHLPSSRGAAVPRCPRRGDRRPRRRAPRDACPAGRGDRLGPRAPVAGRPAVRRRRYLQRRRRIDAARASKAGLDTVRIRTPCGRLRM